MNTEERTVARLSELIERGEEIKKTRKPSPEGFIGFDSTVEQQSASQWHTNSLNILVKALGRDSEHYRTFEKCFEKGVTYSPLVEGIGILNAAKEDVECGYIQEIRTLVEAELFSDFLDQASELLKSGYAGPAAVLTGAVLEDELRKLCMKHDVPLSTKPKLDSMNGQLAKVGAYNKLIQKRITALAGIRNSAAHGKWTEFTDDDVTDMIQWITRFTEDHTR